MLHRYALPNAPWVGGYSPVILSCPRCTELACIPQIIEKQVEGVTVPVYPGNSASILAAKDGPVKDRRLAAGVPKYPRTQCLPAFASHMLVLSPFATARRSACGSSAPSCRSADGFIRRAGARGQAPQGRDRGAATHGHTEPGQAGRCRRVGGRARSADLQLSGTRSLLAALRHHCADTLARQLQRSIADGSKFSPDHGKCVNWNDLAPQAVDKQTPPNTS